MSNNASQNTDSKKQGAAAKSDAASFVSASSTLCDNKGAFASAKDASGKKTRLDDSATSFAKKAKEEGWAAPTATRPSFGG